MDAFEFAKQRRRMCKALRDNCSDCKLFKYSCYFGAHHATDEDDKRIIEAVEQWVKEHPEKTRQSELLKMFPDAVLGKDGYILVRPCNFEKSYLLKCRGVCRTFAECDNCRRKYWLTPVED